MRNEFPRRATALSVVAAAALSIVPTAAHAQASVKPDGQWRAAIGAGLSIASGNTSASSLSLVADAVRKTSIDKWSLYAKALRAKSSGTTTAEQYGLGGRYDRDLTGRLFVFGMLDFLRDRPANLKQRIAGYGGVGYHLIKTDTTTWDVFGGLGHARDSFFSATLIDGATRTGYGRTEMLVGEESSHKLSDTTSFKQRLTVYPNLSNSGEYRALFDAGLSVAMSKTLNLTASLAYRYNSDPGTGLKKGDTLFVTGVSMKFD